MTKIINFFRTDLSISCKEALNVLDENFKFAIVEIYYCSECKPLKKKQYENEYFMLRTSFPAIAGNFDLVNLLFHTFSTEERTVECETCVNYVKNSMNLKLKNPPKYLIVEIIKFLKVMVC